MPQSNPDRNELSPATRGALALVNSGAMPNPVRQAAAGYLVRAAESGDAGIVTALREAFQALLVQEEANSQLAPALNQALARLELTTPQIPAPQTATQAAGPQAAIQPPPPAAAHPAPPALAVAQLLLEAQKKLNQGQAQAALELLQSGQERWEKGSAQEQALGHALLGRAHEGLGATQEAHDHYRAAVERAPEVAAAAAADGLARTTAPEDTALQETEATLQELARQVPDQAGPEIGQAILAERRRDQAAALAHAQAAASRADDPLTAARLGAYVARLSPRAEPAGAGGETTISGLTQAGGINVAGNDNIVANELNMRVDRLESAADLPPELLQRLLQELGQRVSAMPTLTPAQRLSFQRAQREAERAARQGNVSQAAAALRLSFVNYLFIDQPAQRRALIRAARAYREQPVRRPLLFLQELARRALRARLDRAELERLRHLPAAEQRQRQEALAGLWSAGMVTVRESSEAGEVSHAWPPAQIAAGAAAHLAARDWRRLAQEERLQVEGNLALEARAQALAVPASAFWDELYLLLHDDSGPNRFRDSWQRYDYSPLGPQVKTVALHAFYPEEHLPFERSMAEQALRRLGLAERVNELTLNYRPFMAFAGNLLADQDLGFESLADVGLFLRQMAAGELPFLVRHQEEEPLLPALNQSVALQPARFDTTLTLNRGVFGQMASALAAGNHVIVIGPPGTGKTTVAQDVCRHAHDLGFNRGFLSVTATADWTTFDTVGGYMPQASGELLFSEGIVLRAIREEKWLVIDEINRADIDKAFGELFTVLSGQEVTLPYRHGYAAVRILPAGSRPQTENDYVIPPAWRIIGTMNVYDKASLFEMSYAFMRRFAFVDVGIPQPSLFEHIIDHLLRRHGLANGPAAPLATVLKTRLFNHNEKIMQNRQLGPAIARDMIAYIARRQQQEQQRPTMEILAEAFLLYALPQFDGLEEKKIGQVFDYLTDEVFAGENSDAVRALRQRIRELFPQYADAFRSEEEIARGREE